VKAKISSQKPEAGDIAGKGVAFRGQVATGDADEQCERRKRHSGGAEPCHQGRPEQGNEAGGNQNGKQNRAERLRQGLDDRTRLASDDAVGAENGKWRREGAITGDQGDHHAKLVEPDAHDCDASPVPLARTPMHDPDNRWRLSHGIIHRVPVLQCRASGKDARRRKRARAGRAYFRKPFFFRKSSATALAGSPPTWTRPLSSCSVTRSSFSNTGLSSVSISGCSFSTASRMIGAGW
jgi:hypothetical protein